MHANQTHPHYSPSWVGGLMDPVFLRHAVNDAEGERHAEDSSSTSTWNVGSAGARSVASRTWLRLTGAWFPAR